MKRKRVVAHGTVQGVFFRDSTERAAGAARGRAMRPADAGGMGAAIATCGAGGCPPWWPMKRTAITTRTAAAATYAIRCRRSGSSMEPTVWSDA